MINLFHRMRYWTDYLVSFSQSGTYNILLPSVSAKYTTELASTELYDPSRHKDLVVTGPSMRVFGLNQRVIYRAQHSPGFGVSAFLYFYNNCREECPNYVFLYPLAVEELLKRAKLSSKFDAIRARMLRDSRVRTTSVDPSLNFFARWTLTCPPPRESGTLLVSLNFRAVRNVSNIRKFLSILDSIRPEFTKITMLSHPMSDSHYAGHRDLLERELANRSIPYIHNQPLMERMCLYDTHEFILTDGSGTVYEAVARGCKSIILNGMGYQKGRSIYAIPLENNCVPGRTLEQYRRGDSDNSFTDLVRLHGGSVTTHDMSFVVAEEINNIFRDWPSETELEAV